MNHFCGLFIQEAILLLELISTIHKFYCNFFLPRAHLNDLENILPLVLISFIYVLTDPMPAVAVNIFRVVTAARIWHTIVYAIVVIPQPARAIGFFIPYIAMFYMAIQSAIVFFN